MNNIARMLAALALTVTAVTQATATPVNVNGTMTQSYVVRNSQAFVNTCSNSGDTISFAGDVFTFGALWVHVDAMNNQNGSKTLSLTGTAEMMVDFGQNFPGFKKQGGINGGVGGNPYLYFVYDNTQTTYKLGRCVQGATSSLDDSGPLAALYAGQFYTSECSPSRTTANTFGTGGPNGIPGTIWAQNKEVSPTQQSSTTGSMTADNSFTLSTRAGQAGRSLAGGNPHLFLTLYNAAPVDMRDSNQVALLNAATVNSLYNGGNSYKDANGNGWNRGSVIPTNLPMNFGRNGYAGRCHDLLK